MNALRSGRARVALYAAMFGLTPLLSGCGEEEKKTGTLVERTPEQEKGEKASMDAMKAMMKK